MAKWVGASDPPPPPPPSLCNGPLTDPGKSKQNSAEDDLSDQMVDNAFSLFLRFRGACRDPFSPRRIPDLYKRRLMKDRPVVV